MTILSIFQWPPMASIWTFWQSDFACTGQGTGILKNKTFWEVWGTFSGQKVQKSGFLGKKWSFWPFSKGHHRLQFEPFDNPISRARVMELGHVCAPRFRGYWTHLGVKKSKKVQIFTVFLIFRGLFEARKTLRTCHTTHQHEPHNFYFHHIPILGPPVGLLWNIPLRSKDRLGTKP